MNNTQTALNRYGSWEQLLKMIDEKLSFYLQIPRIYQLMKDGGLRPECILSEASPAYFSDAIAQRCLSSYDETETVNAALERCMTDQLHESFTQMEKADRMVVSVRGRNWEQYTTDALLRFAWRRRGTEMEIPFYLTRCGASELSEEFLLTVGADTILLKNCTKGRIYELPAAKVSFFEEFYQELCRRFRLATEEDGYFVPEYVWLCTDAPMQPSSP